MAACWRCLRALTVDQIDALQCHVQLLPIDVSTIESAGGSVRCMLAGIHLKTRPQISV